MKEYKDDILIFYRLVFRLIKRSSNSINSTLIITVCHLRHSILFRVQSQLKGHLTTLGAYLPTSINRSGPQRGFFFNVYFSEGERERMSRGGAKRERERERARETQNLKQAPGSELSAQSPCRA